MCVIAYKPKGIVIDREVLELCFDANPDGAGFVLCRHNELLVRKGFFTFAEFWQAYRETVTKADQCLIHFRIKTHGRIDRDNCHPHKVRRDLYLVHNGILPVKPADPTISDTIHFCRTVLRKLPVGWEYNTTIIDRISREIGKSNKLALINRRNHITLINESCGIWIEGAWYSNDLWDCTYKPTWNLNECRICGGLLGQTETERSVELCGKCIEWIYEEYTNDFTL